MQLAVEGALRCGEKKLQRILCVLCFSSLVYLGREWGRVSVKELGRRLHRDPSVISRLYSAYAADRDQVTEALLAKQLQQQGKSNARHQRLTVTVTRIEDDCCIY